MQSSFRKRVKAGATLRTANTTTGSQSEASETSPQHIEENHHHEGQGEEPMRTAPSEALRRLTRTFFTGFCSILHILL